MTSVATPADGVVTLRALRVTDRPAIRRWMADLNVIGFTVVVPGPDYGPVEPYSRAAADTYLAMLMRDPTRRSFAILLDGAHVGNVGLKAIDERSGQCECFIEIGDERARRRGAGAAAMAGVLEVAFEDLRLQRVRLGVFEFNDAAIGLYRKIGFVDIGRLGDHWVDGKACAVNAMQLDALAWMQHRRPKTVR